MARPKHSSYDEAYEKLGAALKEAQEAYTSGTIGMIPDRLYEAIIAFDDCMAFDDQESRFTRARPILEVWRKS